MRSFLEEQDGASPERRLAEKCTRDNLASLDRICLSPSVIRNLERKAPFAHGLWSAINISKRLRESGLPWKSVLGNERESLVNLLEAVAVHHQAVLPKQNPLVGILVLADELQEWGRVTRGQAEEMVDVGCFVEVERAGDGELWLRFNYSAKDMERVRWSLKKSDRDKQRNIARLDGQGNMPKFVVKCNLQDSHGKEPSASRE
jgi:hypothetical protein